MPTLLQSPYCPYIFHEDYTLAVVHLAWLVRDGVRHLVFGFIELVPSEFSKVDTSPEQGVRSSSNKNWRLFFERFEMDAAEALSTYAAGVAGSLRFPIGPKKSAVEIKIHEGSPEPTWPELILSNGAPYLSEWGQSVRTHHILPKERTDMLHRVASSSRDITWLKDRLFFSLADHSYLLGSFHLIAPNPLLRSLNAKLVTTPSGEKESVQYTPKIRSNTQTEGLTLWHYEKRPTGYTFPKSHRVGRDPIQIELAGMAEEVGHIATCDKRGLLEISMPTGFMRQMNISTSITSGQTKIVVPGKNGDSEKEYTIAKRSHDLPMIIGDKELPNQALRLFRTGQLHLETRRQGKKYGQHWFHGNPEEAEKVVRGLVAKARRRLWIIDPYFFARELFVYALTPSSTDIEIVVATSAEALRKPDTIDGTQLAGEMMLKQLPQFEGQYNLKAVVLRGRTSPVHDRFLVIDDTVWFVGCSLHTLGERASMIIKLPDPSPIIAHLEEIITSKERATTLAEWVEQKRTAHCEIDRDFKHLAKLNTSTRKQHARSKIRRKY